MKPLLRGLLKWTLFIIVAAFVCRQAVLVWNQNAAHHPTLTRRSAGWLLVSALLYVVSWFPSVFFWRALMSAIGGRISVFDACRAFYCAQLGKYVPGKAMVLVLRAALVKDRGCSPASAALTATYETLAMMGTGIALGAALAPWLFRTWIETNAPHWARPIALEPLWAFAGTLAVCVLALPFLSKLLTFVASKAVPESVSGSGPNAKAISSRLIGAGCAGFVVAWAIQGLSLGATVQAVAPLRPDLGQWPVWTGAMALAVSLGFLVLFAPGGLGIREAILLFVLGDQPAIGAQTALAAAVLIRAVSFVSEMVAAAILYFGFRASPSAPAER
jgi:hypothetical protein